MYFADIKRCDIANGPGVRTSIFVSGCNHHCKGCFNEAAWDFKYGKEFTQNEIDKIIKMLEPDYIKGLSLLGGEPFELINQEGLLLLLQKVKEIYPNKDIWCYTGYLFDIQIRDEMLKKYKTTKEFIKYIDVIVDGKFDIEKKNPSLKFRGSYNQRIIKVQESLKENKIILWEGIEQEYTYS